MNDCGLSITVFNRFFRFYRSFGGMDPSLSSFGAEGVPPNQQSATRNNLPAQKPIHGNSSSIPNSEKPSKPVAAIKPVVKSVKPQVQKERSKYIFKIGQSKVNPRLLFDIKFKTTVYLFKKYK